MTPGDTSEEENPVEEATIETSPLAALAEQNMARVVEVVMSDCPPGSRSFPIPDPASNAKRPLDFTPFAEAMAGIPALSIPTGRAVDQDGKPGQPTGVVITGPYLSDGPVLAVGYALEQALNVQLQPDLDATIQQIEAVTGR